MSSTFSAQASRTREPAPYITAYSARYLGEVSASKIASTAVPLSTKGRCWGTFGVGMEIATSGRSRV